MNMNRQEASRYLQVPLDATEETIKGAYKKLAKQYHPDRPGGSTQKFQKLQQAQETMLKPPFHFTGGGVPPGMPSNLFHAMFQAHARSNANIFTQTTQTFPLRNILQGTVRYKNITIPNWVKDGDTLKVGQNERLVIRFQWPPGVSQHPSGRSNLLLRKSIRLDRLLLGREIRIVHPDGRPLRVRARGSLYSSQRHYVIRNEGLPDRNGTRGDLYVSFVVSMPESYTAEQRELLEKVFPEEPLPNLHHETEVDCVEC